MKVRWVKIILSFFFLFLIAFTPPGHTETQDRSYPLPVVELETILFKWLMDSGFKVTRRDLGGFQVLLKGVKEEETWELTLRPQSPLASSIQPHYFLSGQPVQETVKGLWGYLESYLRSHETKRTDISSEIPTKVKSHTESVVCIKVHGSAEEIQFTGFIVDQTGLILTTAHDLKGIQKLTVLLANGQEQKGRLVKIDPHRDLSLIEIHPRLKPSISLASPQRPLRDGERVYSIGCPGNHHGFLSGTVDGPLRRVHDLPLWQVVMEIQPGSSGSPVFNGDGNLVGVVKGRYRGTHSTGFLIPLTTILEFLREK